jgi:hypothetical protein
MYTNMQLKEFLEAIEMKDRNMFNISALGSVIYSWKPFAQSTQIEEMDRIGKHDSTGYACIRVCWLFLPCLFCDAMFLTFSHLMLSSLSVEVGSEWFSSLSNFIKDQVSATFLCQFM